MTTTSPPSLITASVGRKILMAVSGAIFVLFVIVHLLGNLQLFIGQEQLNKYAETLQHLGAIKYAFRTFLFLFFALHIWQGIAVWWKNKTSRPVAYVKDVTLEASVASRTMIYTGAVIVAFVVYHLLQFTLLVTNPQYASIPLVDGRHDVYSMVIMGFQNPWISLSYICAMILLGFHLSHAVSSMFQTMGLNDTKYKNCLKNFGNILAIVICLGYLSLPIAVLTNFITLPGGGY